MKAEEVLKEVQRYKKIGTNADKIRSMSDEELAEIIMLKNIVEVLMRIMKQIA